MHATRIVKLADGEELISWESVEQACAIEDDPRREILECGRRAGSVSETSSR